MRSQQIFAALILAASVFAASLFHAGVCSADVFVFANRTTAKVAFQVSPESGRPFDIALASGEVRPVWSDDPLQVTYVGAVGRESFLLDPNTAYYFGAPTPGVVALRRIGLGGDATTAKLRKLPGEEAAEPLVIPVKILVDEDEPTLRSIWEKKLRNRVASASRVLHKHAGVQLKVVGVGEWLSSNDTTEFNASLREFEQLVKPGEARIAIGFTSQYEAQRGRIHLGGTRGPTSHHVLIREWSNRVSERERLELLLHELGHFLGATHSPEPDSVMRPLLGDRKARRKEFDVRFDPVNTLVIAMVAEEMRRRGIDRFNQLSEPTRRRLGQIYSVMGQAMPDDPASKSFQARVRVRPARSATDGTRAVLGAIVAAAREAPKAGLSGDALTVRLVRAAADQAATLPAEEAPRALLLALGIAMDDSNALRELTLTRQLVTKTETEAFRRVRLRVLGKPTVSGRRDLAKHFFLSACLTAAADAEQADRLGIAKESLDAQGGSGFSFVDLAANRAGIRFAKSLLEGRLSTARLAQSYRPQLYMPSIKGLPEGLQNDELLKQFGVPGDPRFDAQLQAINDRIDSLPVYLAFDSSLMLAPASAGNPASSSETGPAGER